ncbi:MAG: hypothetical protein IKA48_01090 [Fibrobacter sp.]|nr:hypothetical protein [Fibrobacter sp.]
MKKIFLAIPFAVLVGCGNPTPENHCCTEGDCGFFGTLYMEKAKCLERMVNGLEKKVEIMELKMHYECGETK